MEKFDEVVLFNIAKNLDFPDLLNFCILDRRINRLICQKEHIWRYKIEKEFPSIYNDYNHANIIRILDLKLSIKDTFKFLYILTVLKEKLFFEKDIYFLYGKKILSVTNKDIGELPKEITVLNNLNTLKLTNIKMEVLPKEIGKLDNLKILDLGNNLLKNLPKEIAQLNKLRRLYLGNNLFDKCPEEIIQLKLTTLFLDGNFLTEFPKEVEKITSLKYLNVRDNLVSLKPEKRIIDIIYCIYY